MRAVLVSSPGADHFVGVDAALSALGLGAQRGLAAGPDGSAVLPEGARVVVVSDIEGPETRRAIRLADGAGLPVVLMMDGVVEYRNTYRNPRSGPGFLRPAPADTVCVAGEPDKVILDTLGHPEAGVRVVATGLPRLDGLGPMPLPGGTRLLVATARTPAFDAGERGRLVRALGRVRDAARTLGLAVTWRLSARLELEVGVENDEGPLAEALAGASAVLTTPSTLALEAMRAGRATALLDAQGVPCWVRAPAAWHARLPVPDPALDDAYPMETHEGPGGLYRLVRSLADDAGRLLLAQAGLVPRVCPTGAAARVAEAIVDAARRGSVRPKAARLAPVEVVAQPVGRIAGLRRAVNLYITDGEPFGGVPVWCDRMSAAFAERPDLGWEVRTLIVSTRRWWREGEPVPGLEPGAPEPSVCLIDPGAGPAGALATVRASLEALGPDIVTPQYGDLCHAAAAGLAPAGVRTVVMMQTDDWVYRSTLDAYPDWHGAVGGSDACGRFVLERARGRPVATIRNGVRVLDAPREVSGDSPLRLAYVGRMAELQKRLTDLHALADGLEERGVEAEIHLVGDGPDLDAFLARERAVRRDVVRFVAHGARAPGWVQAFWPAMDCCVLVSENEGTSIVTLEAMGCGVVPVVTRVGSGAEDWIDDGTSGVIVGIGDMPAMADALARLHRDRDGLRAMARAAWASVRGRANLGTAAEAYASLFDEVMARAIERAPSDAGVRLLESHRWKGARSTEPERDEAFLRERLIEAGYRAVETIGDAGSEPGAGAEALVVTAAPTPELMRRVGVWRSAGLGVALAPGVIEPEWVRLGAGLERAAQHGSRLAVYGAGDHTRRASRAFDWARERGIGVVAIIDDEPGAESAFGLPLVTPGEALDRLKIDAVVLSSDAWEGRMWERSAVLRARGVHVQALYGGYAEGPAPASMAFPSSPGATTRLTASA